MLQEFDSYHNTDVTGAPAGGGSQSVGVAVSWQDGPLGRGDDRQEPNGAFVETVIAIVVDRIRFYQTVGEGKYACRQNALAITKLEEALHWMFDRTLERQNRGVEGTHTP